MFTGTLETATTLLTNMVAASSRPVLTAADLTALLDRYKTRDLDGRTPADTGYLTTWNLNAAAAEGWRWKAAKVAGDYTFSADDASYSKGDVLAHCTAMAAEYAAKDHGNLADNGPETRDYLADHLWP